MPAPGRATEINQKSCRNGGHNGWIGPRATMLMDWWTNPGCHVDGQARAQQCAWTNRWQLSWTPPLCNNACGL
eukprot:5087044-Lingulodinium_polyedra.AAC.1